MTADKTNSPAMEPKTGSPARFELRRKWLRARQRNITSDQTGGR